MKVFIELNINHEIVGWVAGDYPLNDKCIEIDIPEDHEFFINHTKYKYIDGQLVEDNSAQIRIAKNLKDEEINLSCKEAIVKGFAHNINGERYWFSYDIEAQINFERLRKMFDQNIIHERNWTVKNSNGEHTKIMIDKAIMQELSIIAQKHVDRKVSKYRDYYMSLIMDAQTIEEVEEIQWTTDEEIISEEELQAELDRLNNTPTVEQLQIENEGLRTALLELGDLLLGGLE